jgi:hypothetical protein
LLTVLDEKLEFLAVRLDPIDSLKGEVVASGIRCKSAGVVPVSW